MDPVTADALDGLTGTAWCSNPRCGRLIYRLILGGSTVAQGGRWYHRHNASTTCTGSTGRAKP